MRIIVRLPAIPIMRNGTILFSEKVINTPGAHFTGLIFAVSCYINIYYITTYSNIAGLGDNLSGLVR